MRTPVHIMTWSMRSHPSTAEFAPCSSPEPNYYRRPLGAVFFGPLVGRSVATSRNTQHAPRKNHPVGACCGPEPGSPLILWERWFHRDWGCKLQGRSKARPGVSSRSCFVVGVCLQTKGVAIRLQAYPDEHRELPQWGSPGFCGSGGSTAIGATSWELQGRSKTNQSTIQGWHLIFLVARSS